MTTHPWDADRELTPDQVRAVARQLYPSIRQPEIVALGNGWDFDAYRIGDKAVRFPRRWQVDQSLESRPDLGVQLMDILSPLGVTVPLARIIDVGDAFPYRVTVHPWIEGVSLDRLRAGESTAQQLGEIMTMVHSGVGPEAQGLPVEGDRCQDWLEEALGQIETLRPLLGELERPVTEWLLNDPEIPPPYDGPLRFIHNDMSPEHVLADPATGRIVAIIDWDDAAWGDPAHDFHVFRNVFGAAFTDAMVEAYVLPVDPHFRARIDFQARVDSIDWMYESLLMGNDPERHRRWVENAFS